jgi:hypothetical protein
MADPSHRVKITVSGQMRNNNTALATAYATLKMDATDLDSSTSGFSQIDNGTGALSLPASFSVIATPGDINPHTYTVFIKNDDNTTTVVWNSFEASTTLIVEEIV